MQATSCGIYAHYVLNGTRSLEERPPDIKEISRDTAVVERGPPYLMQRYREDPRVLLTQHRFDIVPPIDLLSRIRCISTPMRSVSASAGYC